MSNNSIKLQLSCPKMNLLFDTGLQILYYNNKMCKPILGQDSFFFPFKRKNIFYDTLFCIVPMEMKISVIKVMKN